MTDDRNTNQVYSTGPQTVDKGNGERSNDKTRKDIRIVKDSSIFREMVKDAKYANHCSF